MSHSLILLYIENTACISYNYINIPINQSAHMDKDELHIIHLLEWIEENIYQLLSMDVISKKSGYTKWHLQKMFKRFTGHTMSEYVRSRRLCKAAMMLKFSNMPILDISNELRFSSQQSFTRSFTSFYSVSPARFREESGLQLGKYLGKYNLESIAKHVACEYVYFDHLILYGQLGDYICPINEIKKPHRVYRKDARKRFIADNGLSNEKIYSLSRFHSFDSDNLKCDLHFGVENLKMGLTAIPVISGEFVKFDYEGHEDGIYDFVMSIYFDRFNTLKLRRMDNFDLEIFNYIDDDFIKYSYLIPINLTVDAFNVLFKVERLEE